MRWSTRIFLDILVPPDGGHIYDELDLSVFRLLDIPEPLSRAVTYKFPSPPLWPYA